MTDKRFWDHPKVKKAGLPAIGLWTVAHAWTRDHRQAGFVPTDTAYMFNPDAVLVERLVDARLWIVVQGGFRFNSWTEWNRAEHKPGTAGEMVDRVVGREHPQVTRGALEKQVAILLDEGADVWSLESALKKWLTKPGAGPTLLPFLVSDALREKAEEDIDELLNEAWQSGDLHKLARKGYIFTPSDSEPDGLDVAGVRAHSLLEKRAWIESKRAELKK